MNSLQFHISICSINIIIIIIITIVVIISYYSSRIITISICDN